MPSRRHVGIRQRCAPPEEALEYVCKYPHVESIVFGASSRRNIAQTRQLIERLSLN
jgi:hypothetical protein